MGLRLTFRSFTAGFLDAWAESALEPGVAARSSDIIWESCCAKLPAVQGSRESAQWVTRECKWVLLLDHRDLYKISSRINRRRIPSFIHLNIHEIGRTLAYLPEKRKAASVSSCLLTSSLSSAIPMKHSRSLLGYVCKVFHYYGAKPAFKLIETV